jgi:hypothetical protein
VATQQPLALLPKLVAVPPINAAARPKKKLIRRMSADHSQLRRGFQVAFLVLNLVLGTKFYFWVRQFEAGVIDTNLRWPPGVEGWDF